jgi:hypothetical protein
MASLPTVELLISKCIMQFGEIQHYGKKPADLGLRRRPQDIVAMSSFIRANFKT